MIVVRTATDIDKKFVVDSLMAMAKEVYERCGGLVFPGDKTREWMERCFDFREVALIAEERSSAIGAMLLSPTAPAFDSNYRKLAISNGIYVQPQFRKTAAADELFRAAKKFLKSEGFDGLLDEYGVKNEGFAGIARRHGAEHLSHIVLFPLEA